MEKEYDIIIIGTGVAGGAFAARLPSDMNVAVIDSREYGGTCANRGCDPKKVLVGAAELIDWNNRMEGKGGPEHKGMDWPSLMSFKRTFTDDVPENVENYFSSRGMDKYHGAAHFRDESTIAVGDDLLRGKYIFIATGAEPRNLDIPGEEYVITSEQFLELDDIPKRIIFIGGGYISFEFAHVAARAGCDVSILQRDDLPLAGFDRDMVDMLFKASKAAGIKIYLDKKVNGIEKKGDEFFVKTEGDEVFEGDLVVHGAGRLPAINKLDLEKGNVAVERGAIAVNEYMQSVSNPVVYAAGDCTKVSFALTPVANYQANVAAENILEGNKRKVDHTAIPSTVFTIPPLATVGIRGDDAKPEHKVLYYDMSQWYSARRTNLGFAASKVIIDEKTDRILGAHIMGHNAEDVINLFAMAMRLNLTLSQFKEAIFVYPSICYDTRYMIK